MSNPNKILLGLIGAAAVGVVLGILLAPEKGDQTRQKIADKASDLASRIGDLVISGKSRLEEAGEDAYNKATDLGESLVQKAESTRHNII